MSWLPIESAPQETYVLVAYAGGEFPLVGIAFVDGVVRDARDEAELWPQPTHWQPLPSPPET